MKKENRSDKPLLSVCLITYNHVNYIERAIESVLIQQVNFPWELIIADDCSSDGTREILVGYQKKYPAFIKLILQKKNVGAAQNWIDLITYPTAKYIAYFEGDDFWTDPLKLQKQADFLEVNPDYILCFHDIFTFDDDGRVLDDGRLPAKNKRDFEVNELLLGEYLPSPSLVYRNISLPHFDIIQSVFNGDTFLLSLLSQKGKAHYLPDVLPSAIRLHEGGVWSSKTQLVKWEHTLHTYFTIYTTLNQPLKNYVFGQYSWFFNHAFKEAIRCKNRKYLFAYYQKYFRFLKESKSYKLIPMAMKNMVQSLIKMKAV